MPPDGYAWWYVDGISDDGRRSLSAIAFIGSVFSPWYRWSGRRRPANHCCLNVATYGPGGRWAMTDRGEAALRLSADRMEIGPSSLHWRNGALEIEFDEVATPRFDRLAGRITVTPAAITGVELPLTADGRHVWRPFAPVARISVDIDRPGWRWEGHGYLDANFGLAALEADFRYWTWARYPTREGALCLYDGERSDAAFSMAVAFDRRGEAREVAPPPRARLPRSLWAVRRETRADPGTRPRNAGAMLDAPFYCRSLVETEIGGERVTGVHEALDLRRFSSPWLMPMLALRVPRRAAWP